ncbi:hypothetical protein MYA_2837 [Burkholderia sp. KJ006]|nr:hypothetical protein MYA_2837 [Burkholderia sp. KJ006]
MRFTSLHRSDAAARAQLPRSYRDTAPDVSEPVSRADATGQIA